MHGGGSGVLAEGDGTVEVNHFGCSLQNLKSSTVR
jgi:hypothetical protein